MNPSVSDPALLRVVLEPLLKDFQSWFKRTRDLLEQEQLSFLGVQEQSELLAKIRETQRQVTVAQSLLDAVPGETSLEVAVLMPWHQLVLACWQISTELHHQQVAQSSAQSNRSRC